MTLHFRALTPRPTTFDRDARTIEAYVGTGAPVARGGFEERLDLSGADLSRLIGAPVLDGHRAETTRDVIGVIEATEIRDGAIWVRIKFRSNEAATAIMNDVADGTLRGLSVGYTVQTWRDSQEGKRRIRTATKWTPIEVSIVPIPADPSAHFRAGVSAMPDDNVTTTAPDDGQTTTQTQDAAQTQTRAQINREIRSMAQMANLPATWADEQIDAESSLDDARAAAFAAMQTRQAQTQTRSTRATILHDNADPAIIAARLGEAIYTRAHPDHQISEPARQYAPLTLAEMARVSLQAHGINTTHMHPETLVTRALQSTSTLPDALGESARRELRRPYQSPPSGARAMARQTTARDFRAKHKIMMSEAPTLEKVNESGEFKSGAMHDSAETYRVETFGRIAGFTRQAIINDDIGALQDIPAKWGIQALNFEASYLVNLIESNPEMADGIEVFDQAGHGNDLVGNHTIFAALTTARTAMHRKTGLMGSVIAVTPRFVLVPPELETPMQQALSAIQANETDKVNPFSTLTLAVEPRLTSPSKWYVVADPAIADGLEYAYLEGAPGPQIETRAGFEVDGVQMRVRLDYGAGWIDHRSWHRAEHTGD